MAVQKKHFLPWSAPGEAELCISACRIPSPPLHSCPRHSLSSLHPRELLHMQFGAKVQNKRDHGPKTKEKIWPRLSWGRSWGKSVKCGIWYGFSRHGLSFWLAWIIVFKEKQQEGCLRDRRQCGYLLVTGCSASLNKTVAIIARRAGSLEI